MESLKSQLKIQTKIFKLIQILVKFTNTEKHTQNKTKTNSTLSPNHALKTLFAVRKTKGKQGEFSPNEVPKGHAVTNHKTKLLID